MDYRAIQQANGARVRRARMVMVSEEPDNECMVCGWQIEIEGNSMCVTCDYEEREALEQIKDDTVR